MTAAAAPGEDAAATVPSRPMVGIIYPPAGIRDIIDKTAGYVIDKGPKFMELVCKNEANNTKFNFLQETDPYHAYFKYMLDEGRSGVAEKRKVEKAKEEKERRNAEAERRRVIEEQAMRRTRALRNAGKTLAQIEWSERRKPTSPPEDLHFLHPAPSAYAQTLDIIKVTARFAAGKGKEFTQQLQRREQANPVFDFLKPQHSMFAYFGKLVEQYTLIMLSEGKTAALERIAADAGENGKSEILERVLARSHFAQRKREMEDKEKEDQEKERIQYQQIDWYDFVVVGTLEFTENEQGEFPPPVKKEDIGGRVLAQERAKNAPTPKPVPTAGPNITAMQDDNDDMDMSDDDDEPAPPPAKTDEVAAPEEEDIIIRDFDPKKKEEALVQGKKEIMLESPWTGELVPASQLEKHSKIITLDPRWGDKKNAAAEDKRNTVYSGDAMTGLQNLAKTRTDIFGTSATEAKMGQTVEQKEAAGSATSARMRLAQGQSTSESQLKVLQTMHTDIPLGKDAPHVSAALPPGAQAPRPAAQPTPVALQPQAGPKRAALPPLSQVMPAHAQQRRFGHNQPPPPRPPGGPAQQTPGMPGLPPPTRLGAPGLPPPTRLGAGPAPTPPAALIGSAGSAGMHPPQGARGYGPPPTDPSMKRPVPDSGVAPSNDPKRAKQPDVTSSLIDEAEFIAANPGPVKIEIIVPKESNSNWSFNGQTLTLEFALTDKISAVKTKITELITIPANKQKLKSGALGFLKDTMSIAKYNLKSGTSMELSAKTRGGKKQ